MPRAIGYDRATFAQQQSARPSFAGNIDLRFIFKMIRKWWWLAVLIVGAAVMFTSWRVSKIEPTYRSSVVLELNRAERNVVDVSAVEDVRVDYSFLSTQVELLGSASLAERVINQMQLLRDPYFGGQSGDDVAPMSTEARMKNAVARFRDSTSVSAVGRSFLITVSFSHTDPRRAAEIANTLAQAHIDFNLSRRVRSTQYARTYLEDQLESTRQDLQTAERDLATFVAENDLLIVGQNSGDGQTGEELDVTALIDLNRQLSQASIERAAAQAAWEQAQNSQFRSEVLESTVISSLNEDLVDLRSEYEQLTERLQPNHPDVSRINTRISLIENEITQQTNLIISAQRDNYEREYRKAQARESDLRGRIDELEGSVSVKRSLSIDYNIRLREVQTARSQYEALLQRFSDVGVADDLGSDLVQLVDRAAPSSVPYRPNRTRSVLIAAILSSLIAGGIIYVLHIMDDKISDPDDVRERLGIPILGVISKLSGNQNPLEALGDPKSEISEAYASVCTNIQFSGGDRRIQVIQVTSTRPSEGKSVTSAGLALRFAGLGKRVLLIDADMRRPTFEGPSNHGGLAGVLAGMASLDDGVKPTQHNNVFLLSSGRNVPNPSEILGSDKLGALIEDAREYFDYIIIDTPPVMGLADAPTIGARVDGTVMVIQAGALHSPNVRASIDRLRGSGSKILGAVMTKYVRSSTFKYGYYDYSYSYSSSPEGLGSDNKNMTSRLFKKKTLGIGSKDKINLFESEES
ncbi:MAG: polysaccharide biosynthesis tyrosine autokinase [Pseudomonadota bacterium]